MKSIELSVKDGWPWQRADTYHILSQCKQAIARAMRDNDDCYAAATYALCESIHMQQQGEHTRAERACSPAMRSSLLSSPLLL